MEFFLQMWAFFLTENVFAFYVRPLDADSLVYVVAWPLALDARTVKENIHYLIKVGVN